MELKLHTQLDERNVCICFYKCVPTQRHIRTCTFLTSVFPLKSENRTLLCAIIQQNNDNLLHGTFFSWNIELLETLPHQVKTQYLHFKFHANYSLLPGKIPEEISTRSILFHNQRQYLPYQTYVHRVTWGNMDPLNIKQLISSI